MLNRLLLAELLFIFLNISFLDLFIFDYVFNFFTINIQHICNEKK